MITIFGGGHSRSLRVTWLCEEMALPYRLRPVNLLAEGKDAEFLAVNPAGFIPVLQDGDTTMVESVAIMEYLLARYGPTALAPVPSAANFPAYQQFLHLGEAGLAMPLYVSVVSRHFAAEDERDNFGARLGVNLFQSRLTLVTRQLRRYPYLAGESFTAADISVGYAFIWGTKHGGLTLGEVEQEYVNRLVSRDAFQRAVEKS